MKLILTRHGETHENVLKITMGQGVDGDLNEAGRGQARCLAKRLKDEPIEVAYVSDLKRAVRTAEEILKHHPKTSLMLTPELRERNLGIYEGRPNTEWKEAMRKSSFPFQDFQPPGGESYRMLQDRVGKFLDHIIRTHDGSVLVLSHTGTVTMLLLKLLNLSITKENYEAYKPGNTAVTVCEVIRGTPVLQILNSIEHLERPATQSNPKTRSTFRLSGNSPPPIV